MSLKPFARDLPYSVAIILVACSGNAIAQDVGCAASARLMRFACTNDLRDSFYTSTAQCQDSAVFDSGCVEEAQAEIDDGEEECSDIFEARLDLCEALDDATHEPPFGPTFASNFVDPTEIGSTITPNPWFPLVPGNRWTYEGEDEQIVVEVHNRTKLIQGINCLVVTDIVTEEGLLVEDTDDWFAQDVDGNVWYCGEIAENYELFEGSWKSGRDRAKAGMLLPFDPVPGTIIRQEVRYGDAEDVVEIESVTATESAPGGACSDACLRTRDFTPLEPEVEENKFYAPGIGLIVEIDAETGERVELVEFVGVGS